MPGPQGCVGGCLRVVTRGMGVGGRFRGASGTPPPTGCPGKGGRGSLPLIRPCGATFPRGGRQGLLLAAAQASAGRRGRRPLRFAREWAVTEGRGGVGAPALRMGGYGNAVGFTWAPVSGPPRGRGRACPARGVTRTPVNGSVRRGGVLTPPRVAARGMAVGGRFRGASGTPPPTGCPGTGGSGRPPLIRPCGATFPRGGRQGLLLAAAGRRPLPRQLVLGAELEGQAVVPAV